MKLELVVEADGSVSEATVDAGWPVFDAAAREAALRIWFAPYMLDGEPARAVVERWIHFRLDGVDGFDSYGPQSGFTSRYTTDEGPLASDPAYTATVEMVERHKARTPLDTGLGQRFVHRDFRARQAAIAESLDTLPGAVYLAADLDVPPAVLEYVEPVVADEAGAEESVEHVSAVVLLRPDGTVENAHVFDGPSRLRQPSVDACMNTVFSPPTRHGKQVRAIVWYGFRFPTVVGRRRPN